VNLKNLRIVVDEREKKSGIPDLLKGTGINLEIKTLPVGDYIVAPETVVERKTISDLISSIFDGRLFDQCHRLKEHYQFPILIIEGDIDEIEELTENPLVFYGAISSIAIFISSKYDSLSSFNFLRSFNPLVTRSLVT